MPEFTFSEYDENFETAAFSRNMDMISSKLNMESPKSSAINGDPEKHGDSFVIQKLLRSPTRIHRFHSQFITSEKPTNFNLQYAEFDFRINKTAVLRPSIYNTSNEKEEALDLTTSHAIDLRVKSTNHNENHEEPFLGMIEPNCCNTSFCDSGESRLVIITDCEEESSEKTDPLSTEIKEQETMNTGQPRNSLLKLNDDRISTHEKSISPNSHDVIATKVKTAIGQSVAAILHPEASASLIIDDAFEYLDEITDEADYSSDKKSKGSEMNKTFLCSTENLINFDKTHVQCSSQPKTNEDGEKSTFFLPEIVQASDGYESQDHSCSSLSAGSLAPIELDTSVWSVKQAVKLLTSSAITTTQTKSHKPISSATPKYNDESNQFNEQFNSTPNSRIVIGANFDSVAESTIQYDTQNTTQPQFSVVSIPDTPNITACYPSTYDAASRENMSDQLTSTRKEVRYQPIGAVNEFHTPPLQKEKGDYLRKKVLIKSLSNNQLDEESDLNKGFNQQVRESRRSPPKKKRKSLFRVLKNQFLCMNANISQLSQIDETITPFCSGGNMFRFNSQKGNAKRKARLTHCQTKPNDSGATTSFVTLDRSTYSNSLPLWCKEIISTTSHFTPKPSTSATNCHNVNSPHQQNQQPKDTIQTEEPKISRSKSVGICTAAFSVASPRTPNQQNTLNTSKFSWPSQIELCNSPSIPAHIGKSSKGVSTSTLDPASKKQTASRACSTRIEDPFTTSSVTDSHLHNPSSHMSKNLEQSWMIMSNYKTDIDAMDQTAGMIAEWLSTFISDKEMKSFKSRFMQKPNRQMLLSLCEMCHVRVKVSNTDSSMLTLKKTSSSRSPTYTDIKKLVHGMRR